MAFDVFEDYGRFPRFLLCFIFDYLEVFHGSHAAIRLKDATRPALHLLSGVIAK